MSKQHAFTIEYGRLQHHLPTEVHIAPAFDHTAPLPAPNPFMAFKAVWDTGATHTAISQKVIDQLGLVQTGVAKCHHAGGVELDTPTYLVMVGLPNKVAFPGVTVTRAILNDEDVLIGMNIINRGDFVVSNHNDKTVLSFRMPSRGTFNLVTDPYLPNPPPSPNDFCFCDSGRKYKNCHGGPRPLVV